MRKRYLPELSHVYKLCMADPPFRYVTNAFYFQGLRLWIFHTLGQELAFKQYLTTTPSLQTSFPSAWSQ